MIYFCLKHHPNIEISKYTKDMTPYRFKKKKILSQRITFLMKNFE